MHNFYLDRSFKCDEAEEENAMCRRHYTEYLTATINKNKLEVLSLMEVCSHKPVKYIFQTSCLRTRNLLLLFSIKC